MELSDLPPFYQTLIQALKARTNGAAEGTGILKLVNSGKATLGTIPEPIQKYTLGVQNAIFGDYPKTSDIAPSIIFTVIFFIFFVAHLFVFFKNYSRGHKFWLSLCFAFYCLLRVLGFAMRAAWGHNILRLETGMASSVFTIVPIVLIASFNCVLAQRIFTWKHPHLGSTNLVWGCMISLYTIVTGVVVMAIVSALVPYIYFLSQSHYDMCRRVGQAAGILCCIYSLTALIFVIGAFVIPTSERGRETWTYQPWWIESFAPFYYVERGAQKRAQDSFLERDMHSLDAVRIIASTTEMPHRALEKVQSCTSKSGQLNHNWSIVIILVTTMLIFISSVFRCVSLFEMQEQRYQSWIFRNWIMYLMFGVFEVFVNLFYLIGRVDLRFYRPDRIANSIREKRRSSVNNGDLSQVDTLRGSDLEKVENTGSYGSPEYNNEAAVDQAVPPVEDVHRDVGPN
ncbi:hypothetical protein WICPIJ_004770 [Wickerhamomyces pijperi]|uniref:Uncharacterized protein n=1 Tax=Wickerhamomyces pijperi TaxID=599730 RepID=A0A9P8Q785_WICPI|nr:hypothetical protein WICPIJ_004770 [Wickerhamomyces pijperi]